MDYKIINEDSNGHAVTDLVCDRNCGTDDTPTHLIVLCNGDLACPACDDPCDCEDD